MVLVPEPSTGRRSARRRPIAVVPFLVAAMLQAALLPGAVAAQEVALTTPYPSVSVQPGATATFDLHVTADAAVRVDLSVEDVPDGWSTTLRGGGREVSSVFANPDERPELQIDVEVPEDAEPGTTTITVVGREAGETVRLPLDVEVVDAAGSVSLTTDVPARQAAADETFEFSLDLENDTPQQLTFELSAVGPAGWDVTVGPTGDDDATSVTVDARGSQTLTVQATPPAQATENQYPIRVEAIGGDLGASIDLVAAVTGRTEMTLSTADQRLNTTANAGTAREVRVVVTNTGTAPLRNLTLSGSGPEEWEVSFDPATIEEVAPGDAAQATAFITPSGNAVAGDYVVTLRSSTEGVDESIEIRVTVETPPIWGIVGIALIALTLGGLGWVFRRYGRR